MIYNIFSVLSVSFLLENSYGCLRPLPRSLSVVLDANGIFEVKQIIRTLARNRSQIDELVM